MNKKQEEINKAIRIMAVSTFITDGNSQHRCKCGVCGKYSELIDNLNLHRKDCFFRILATASLAHVAEINETVNELNDLLVDLRKNKRREGNIYLTNGNILYISRWD